MVPDLDFPPDQYWHCAISMYLLQTSALCGVFLILSMTFDRFYSIIRPHKAASFNTFKRARKTIICIMIFSIVFNIPLLFLTIDHGKRCVPYAKPVRLVQVFYWISFFVSFIFPFISLLLMNSVIIHTLRKRSKFTLTSSNGQGQSTKIKNSERQIYIMLLVVTFGFLILITPAAIMVFYARVVDYAKSPKVYAGYYFFFHFASKWYYTNNGVNFFLYVIAGQKFRSDLVQLFQCRRNRRKTLVSNSMSAVSVATVDTAMYEGCSVSP